MGAYEWAYDKGLDLYRENAILLRAFDDESLSDYFDGEVGVDVIDLEPAIALACLDYYMKALGNDFSTNALEKFLLKELRKPKEVDRIIVPVFTEGHFPDKEFMSFLEDFYGCKPEVVDHLEYIRNAIGVSGYGKKALIITDDFAYSSLFAENKAYKEPIVFIYGDLIYRLAEEGKIPVKEITSQEILNTLQRKTTSESVLYFTKYTSDKIKK